MTYRVFEKVNILGDARVVVGCLLLVGQLVWRWEVGDGVPGGEEGQQVGRQKLSHPLARRVSLQRPVRSKKPVENLLL